MRYRSAIGIVKRIDFAMKMPELGSRGSSRRSCNSRARQNATLMPLQCSNARLSGAFFALSLLRRMATTFQISNWLIGYCEARLARLTYSTDGTNA
jgi:hypothetical protein